ncbi:queuosine salvage protein-like isoform X2 [Biomphalaria glabrata]|nr:queuosine salvage protein-like isoform X2 [Biomphalaria glabrata]XP_013086154.2 queuosine salvage protein-like isoform X2 [Biomphalaria glabrata]XP_013086155.2 queuosine salvage protein-like isoform X2 [Biomphalaria glabrata]XP_013086156.2 queuosine salvage protein-like isoform X2 [Biomphalaria glabrata]XP_013086157.2 queuosine salvage protein-like isoform X2 [Biomphalaria glabrata]XP_013086158.2 queuosine salvage protein-like isoform X2 [Biomphalaria glabrata]
MEGVMSPRDAGRYITENCQDVSIVDAGVVKLAKILFEKVKTGDFDVKMWRRHELNPQTMDEEAVNWVFLTAVLNFSFWSEKESERYEVIYKGKGYTGYWALCAAVNRALEEGYPITQPSFYATISEDVLKKIFRSDSGYNIPLLDRRLEVLLEAGQVLMERYQGSFVNVIKEANKSAQTLLKLVLQHFSSFRDIAEYNGKKVGFYKRAQILIGDVWGCCEGQGLGEFTDVDTITMFADYRIPQALVYFGVVKYSESLMEELKRGKLLTSGDKQEVEIRGVSLWACELIRDEILRLIKEDEAETGVPTSLTANAILVDHYLWDIRREMADQMVDIPFHRCRGIFY